MDNDKTKVMITGHRPKYWPDPVVEEERFYDSLTNWVNDNDYLKDDLIFIHGTALGVDTWFGKFAMKYGIELHLYLPFPVKTQINKARMDRLDMEELLKQITYAKTVVVVNETYSTYGYQKRNIAMVNVCDQLLAYLVRTRSGSGNAVRYYQSQKAQRIRGKEAKPFNLKSGEIIK